MLGADRRLQKGLEQRRLALDQSIAEGEGTAWKDKWRASVVVTL